MEACRMTKYRAIKTDCDYGCTHDSKIEAARCNQLHEAMLAGTISNLTFQPEFPVTLNGKVICKYIADFQYEIQDCRIVEDVKGMRTPVFNLKRKLVEAAYPGTVITLYPPRKRKARKTKKEAA